MRRTYEDFASVHPDLGNWKRMRGFLRLKDCVKQNDDGTALAILTIHHSMDFVRLKGALVIKEF